MVRRGPVCGIDDARSRGVEGETDASRGLPFLYRHRSLFNHPPDELPPACRRQIIPIEEYRELRLIRPATAVKARRASTGPCFATAASIPTKPAPPIHRNRSRYGSIAIYRPGMGRISRRSFMFMLNISSDGSLHILPGFELDVRESNP